MLQERFESSFLHCKNQAVADYETPWAKKFCFDRWQVGNAREGELATSGKVYDKVYDKVCDKVCDKVQDEVRDKVMDKV